MKKILVIVVILVCLIGVFVGAAWHYGPLILIRIAEKAIGGSINAGTTTIDYKNGAVIIVLKDLRLKGSVDGKIDDFEVRLLPRKGLYIQSLTASGFDLTVRKQQGKALFYPVAVEEAVIRNGVLLYDGQKYTINEVSARNFNTGKKFEFSIDGSMEGFGRIRTHGEGIFGEKRSDLKGRYSIEKLDMARVLKDYEGLTDSEGLFSYKDGLFTMDGEARSDYFSIWEKFLTRRLGLANGSAHVSVTHYGQMTEATISGVTFENAPISIKVKSREKTVLYLEFTMGFMSVPHLIEYVDMAQLADGDWGPFSYVKDGEVRIERLVYADSAPFTASIELRNATAGDQGILFSRVDGFLQIDGQMVSLSNFSGHYEHSRLYDVAGSIPLTRADSVEVTGKYALSLEDLERFYQNDYVKEIRGRTTGAFQVHGMPDTGFTVAGSGDVAESSFVWKTASFMATGLYEFDNEHIDFNDLRVKGAKTDLTASGSLGKDRGATITMAGTIDSRPLASFGPAAWGFDGPVGVDGTVTIGQGAFSARGRADLTNLSWDIPSITKKPSGVISHVILDARVATDGEIVFESLDASFGAVRAKISGKADRRGIKTASFDIDAPGVERILPFFAIPDDRVRGDLAAHFSVSDLDFSFRQLPLLNGGIKLTGGSVLVPALNGPFSGFDLSCVFDRDHFSVDVEGGRVGKTILKKGRLELADPVKPAFSLLVDLDTLDVGDLFPGSGRAIKIPSIGPDSIFARTAGSFAINARQFVFDDSNGEDFRISGDFRDRKIAVRNGNLTLSTGTGTLSGTADLAGAPTIVASIDLANVAAKDALGLVGAETDLIDARGSISARLNLMGKDKDELLRSMAGTVEFSSNDGVIRKWNLLSKILALANIYDLVQGKVDLSRRGLTYRKMSGTFEAKNGVFRTTNFIIDSPSMIVTGRGGFDVPKNHIDGKILVSPLVTLDKILDWIPLVNRIFKEKRAGFVFFIYDVKGPLDDPQITSSYVESMGRRIFNILMNTMRLPKDVLDMLPPLKDSSTP
jgi:hypothetical protein